MVTLSDLTKLIWASIIWITVAVAAFGFFVFGQLTVKGPIGIEMTFGRPDFDKGKVIPQLKDGYQIQFWTPSQRTKETQGIHDWEKIESDDKLDAFAETLMNVHVISGYSRFEVVGAGLGIRKRGAWWVATLNSDKGATVEKFLSEYRQFWKPGDEFVKLETPTLFRDLTQVCAACRESRRCERDLARGDVQIGMTTYCQNGPSIDLLTVSRNTAQQALSARA